MAYLSPMCGALAAAVVLAGCGGSSSSGSSSSSRSASAAATSSPASVSTTSAGAGRRAAAGGRRQPAGGDAEKPGGGINARVPASFTLTSSGRLEPSTVSAPAFVAVQVSVRSGDSRSHRVLIQAPLPRTLYLPARGQAGARLPGMRAGRYAITVDGRPAGALSIGGAPGP